MIGSALTVALTAILFCLGGGWPRPAAACSGSFPNPVTDVCWRCVLPLSIGGAQIANLGGQSDIANPSDPVCTCGIHIGLEIGFWEPAILAEVPREPFCFPTLGGLKLSTGAFQTYHSRSIKTPGDQTNTAYYNAHYYTFPLLYVLGVLADDPCLVHSPIDIGFITEFDPSWNDPTLSTWLNPEAFLFANPVSIAACSVDCVASSVSEPIPWLYWCAGCQGSLEPMQGFVPNHTGGIRTSLLLSERLQAKMHKLGIAWQYHGKDAECGPYPNPVIDRQAYRFQMLSPVPDTAKIGGTCCHNFGGTSVIWGAGKEFPGGEDFSYLLFRKRNCCMFLY